MDVADSVPVALETLGMNAGAITRGIEALRP